MIRADTELIDESISDVLTGNQELGEELEEEVKGKEVSRNKRYHYNIDKDELTESLQQSQEDEVFTNVVSPNQESSRKGRTTKLTLRDHEDNEVCIKRARQQSCLLIEDQHHKVYRPEKAATPKKKRTQFGSIAETPLQNDEDTYLHMQRTSLKERQQDFDLHVKVTQEVVKETTEELINSNEIKTQKQLRGFTVKLSQKVQRQPRMVDVVTNIMAQMKPDASGATATAVYTPSSIAMAWREKVRARKEHMEGIIPVPVEELPNLKKRASRVCTYLIKYIHTQLVYLE